VDDTRIKIAADRIGDQLGRELMTAYVAALRSRSDVKIDQAQLEKK
jgi:hypothetical protein